jgi:hypothetical protein
MAKGRRTPTTRSKGSGKPGGGPGRPNIVRTSLYLPAAVYEALREAAFKQRRKINDIVLAGIELALRNRPRKK